MGYSAVMLLSGGLDSTLALKMMLDQGIELYALNIVTPFCTCTRKGCRHQASLVCEKFGIPLRVIHGGQDYLELVRNPKYGYGSQMNPCIDCRIFLFRKAKELMEELGADFVVTGEVLGERPMSQRPEAIKLIERESGLEGRVLRPLSAKHLKPSLPELKGMVDREKLLDIRGRSRRPQMALAEAFGIEDYPCPAGGCRLTDPKFAGRVRDAIEHDEFTLTEVGLLKLGRHFRLPSGAKVIVGRNEGENFLLSQFASPSDLLLEARGVPGPVVLLKKARGEEDIKIAASMCLRYSDFKGDIGTVLYRPKARKDELVEVEPMDDPTLEAYRI
ncbi:MAG TPA: DUF814 domain-containing protein [Candidatus Latescibacteria bacterium]|nr:DUF814 domain-containing protein [Candidatus Latescibacterota bacterium]